MGKSLSPATDDLAPIQWGLPSLIHGEGAFATRDIQEGEEVVMPISCVRFFGFNHSCNPNLGPRISVDVYPYKRLALRSIKAGEELTLDYAVSKNPTMIQCGPGKQVPCNCEQCRK